MMRHRMGKRGVEVDEDVVAASGMVSLPASPAAAMAAAVGHLGWPVRLHRLSSVAQPT